MDSTGFKTFDNQAHEWYSAVMKSILKPLVAVLALLSPILPASAETPPISVDILFEGFLGDGAVYSVYGYSRANKNVYASVHIEIPGSDEPLDVTRRLPHSKGRPANVAITDLYRQARGEVAHIVDHYGGVNPGVNTFRDKRLGYENEAADRFGNSVAVTSKRVRARDCVNSVLNVDGTVDVDINGEEFVLRIPTRLCLVKAYVTGMWTRREGDPVTAASLTFLSETGDQHVYLAHKRPPVSFLAQISESATRRR